MEQSGKSRRGRVGAGSHVVVAWLMKHVEGPYREGMRPGMLNYPGEPWERLD